LQSREFPPEAHAVGRVRRLVTPTARVRLDHPAVLVASGLATNAVKHARTAFDVIIAVEESIRIEVIDQAPMPPAMTDSSKHGFGMRIIARISDRWGAEEIKGNGKTVWAELLP
jgi:two-component sensor histidine kinase